MVGTRRVAAGRCCSAGGHHAALFAFYFPHKSKRESLLPPERGSPPRLEGQVEVEVEVEAAQRRDGRPAAAQAAPAGGAVRVQNSRPPSLHCSILHSRLSLASLVAPPPSHLPPADALDRFNAFGLSPF